MQAGIGAGYIKQIVANEVERSAAGSLSPMLPDVRLSVRVIYNPNISTAWFASVMGIVNNVTMLAIIMAGAAVVREREHGTMDHLLVMPLRAAEIAAAKVVGNSIAIGIAVAAGLLVVVEMLLQVPVAGSVPLFMLGTMTYLFFATSIGLLLGTVVRSMPQLGLLFMLVAVPIMILSGSNTPTDSMPEPLKSIMVAIPSTHYVSLAEAILFRGAGLDIVWPDFAEIAAVAAVVFVVSLRRFRVSSNKAMG
jgi:ABC-2 type transport system permease protein